MGLLSGKLNLISTQAKQVGKKAGAWEGGKCMAGRKVGVSQAGRQAGRLSGRQAGVWQAGKCVDGRQVLNVF